MNSSNNLDHNQNFINLTKLQRKAWTSSHGTEVSNKKISWKCNSILNRAYFALFSMFISIIITLLILLIHYKNQFYLAKTLTSLNSTTLSVMNGLNQTTTKICLSKECIQSSAYLLDRINFNINPCEDFYEYACGKFLKSRTVPDDHISRNILQEIQDDIYIEMKNYLEKKLIGEEDEESEKLDKRKNDRNSSDKSSDDKESDKQQSIDKKLTNTNQLDLKLDEIRLNKQESNDKLESKEDQLTNQESQSNHHNLNKNLKYSLNNSLNEEEQNVQQLTASDITMEELDQDKFSDSIKSRKRNSQKSNNSKPHKELNAVRKVKMFYRSCMNETTVNDESTSVNVILNLIYEYGGEWALLSRASYFNKTFKQIKSIQNPTYRFDTKKPVKNKLETRIYSVFLHQIQPIFHFYVAPQEFKRNSKDYAIHLYPGSTILEASYFLNNTLSNSTTNIPIQMNYREAYARLQLDILIKLAAIKGRSVNQTEAKFAIEKVVAFEADLANITKIFSENSTNQNEDIITDMNASKNNLQNESSNLNSNSQVTSKTNYSGESVPQILNNQQRSKTAYIKLNLTTLESKYNIINWPFLFNRMEESSSPITEILLENVEYLEQIELLFKRHDLITIDNYLCWATIARFLPYLGTNFRRTFTDFRRKIPDPPTASSDLQQMEEDFTADIFKHINILNNRDDADENQLLERYRKRKNSASTTGRMFLSRWKECVHLTSEGLKKPIAILYLQEKKDYVKKIADKVNKMIDNIKDAFFRIVDKQDWLISNEIKELVKKRAESIKSKIGFPEYLMNLEKADEEFENLEIKLGDVFVANIIKMVRHEIKGELRLLNETIDPDKDWMIDTLIPNAYYDALNHFIILPVAILREPLISLKRPKYLDYATLGVVIGHEIAHAFDTGTRKEYLMNLNISNKTTSNNANISWWPRELNIEYDKKSQCFVKQFNNYSMDEINENLNGNLTLEENICDFSGFQQAYYAFMLNRDPDEDDVLLPGLTNMSPEQIFFVQYAQVWCEISNKEGYKKALLDSHSPGRFRANGVVSNSKQYSEAFNCKLNDPMNASNKCDLWAY